ncbi:hypothetical protein ACOI1H_14860 [Loktanella sp. DJP18]|uniref:hypothetical protein n=1 Tax=Loktanella sp. DJP18 TaxID=3409788 RepID=UPI003BB5D74D
MTYHKFFRILASTAILGVLTGCMSGSDGGGGTSLETIAPLAGMTEEQYSKLQARGVVAKDGVPTRFTSVASTRTSGSGFDEPVGREEGSLTFRSGEEQGGVVTRNPTVTLTVNDLTGDAVSFHPRYDQSKNSLGRPVVSGSPGDVNGKKIYLGRRTQNLRHTAVVYLPRGDGHMYVGGYASDIQGLRWSHGVFGRETTPDEVRALHGSATFNGVGAATVNYLKSDEGEGGGFYEGNTSATVNFVNNTYVMDGNFTGKSVAPFEALPFTMSSSGKINPDGSMTGTVTYGGLDAVKSTINGDVDGHLFGPGGQSIGATFIGHGNDASDNYVNIVGHAVLNRN